MKVWERTENGVTTHVTMTEGLKEISHAQMAGKRDVRTMSGGNRGWHIEYKDGRSVRFVRVDVDDSVMEPKPEPAEVHVQSYTGGKVHSMMPGMDEHPYPLCRGGGMNQHLTKFRAVNAPLTCKTCLTYAERRAARLAREGS